MKAAVFDWDGTLVDIDEREFHSINRALVQNNLPEIDEEFYIQNYYRRPWETGTGPRMVIEAALRRVKDPLLLEQAYESYRGTFASTVDRARLQQGARETLVALKERGLRLGIATMRYTRSVVGSELEVLGLGRIVDAFYTRQDVGARADPMESLEETVRKRSQLVEKTLGTLGVGISDSFLVGDSWWDVRAGKRLGIRTVIVKTGFSRHNDFSSEKPDIILDSMVELVPTLKLKKWIS